MNSLKNTWIVRCAPSPTGIMHIGTARTAYFNWLAAKASNGKFVLRIDDTDVERNKEEYTKIILDSLEWLGLDYDEVYYQSKRTELYKSEARGLLNAGKAKELDNGAIALRFPNTMPDAFMDSISGNIAITDTNKAQIHEKVILLRGWKTDEKGKVIDRSTLGLPTYQLGTVIDDYFLDINWIIRGVDHITNTPKQIAIWCALNEVYSTVNCPKPFPKFTHLGLINKQEEIKDDTNCTIKLVSKKLSKRGPNAALASVMYYRDQGYTPEALLNFMLRLGWSPKGDNKEHTYISKERAIELFTNGNLKNSPANYDLNKLNALEKHYKGS